jgi:signal transduction histidine kinase
MTAEEAGPGGTGGLHRRIVVSALLLSGLVALLLVGIVQAVLSSTTSETVHRVLVDRAEAVVSSVDAATRGTAISVPDSRLDAGVVVYDGAGRPVAGQVPPSLAAAFATLAGVTRTRTLTAPGGHELIGEPFTTRTGAVGVAVVAERLAPYEDAERAALVVSILSGVVLIGVATGAAATASRRTLQPVVQMARTADDWSEHDLGRRFALGAPTDELRALGHTLDALLDKVERAITTEQRLTSELAHELRSPLTAAQGRAELVLDRPGLDPQVRADVLDIHEQCRTMAETISGLLDLARAQTGSAGRAGVGEVLEAVRRQSADPARVVVSRPAGPDAVGVPLALAARVVAPVVENALRHGTTVTLSAERADHRLRLLVSDDGPGVPEEEAERLFDPGWSTSGSGGLGLPLARRIAHGLGGEVRLVPADGGAVFEVLLPAAGEPVADRD